ncbi:hypothetical protein GWI34_03405 [Actinomadura sp. DSM 109109]|nr:hypothetical protein [Actinomadura lepetitiana]
MAHPDAGGLIRWATESDPEGPGSSRITPVLLRGQEPIEVTPNWLWSPTTMKGSLGDVQFGKGKATDKARRKARDLVRGLGLSADPETVVDESTIYELRLTDKGSLYVQGSYAGFKLGRSFEHVLIQGEPATVLADRPETVSIVMGVCNGSNRATISTNPEGRRTSFQLGSHGAAESVDEFVASAGFAPSLSFYEENLARLSAVFAGNVMVHSPDPESVRYAVVIDVPWRGYWLYMYPVLRQSRTTAGVYRQWREEVTRRSALVAHRVAALLREVLGERADQVEIIYRDELAPLDGILASLEPGRVPDIQVLVDVMRNSGDQLWNMLLDPVLRSQVKIKSRSLDPEIHTVQELCGTSYVAAVLRRMLAGTVMSVNDYVEQTIEHYVQEWTRVLTQHGKLTFRGGSFAVYPFSHVVPRELGAVMYRSDPGSIVTVNDRSGISGLAHGQQIDPVDLLPRTYLW